MCTRDKLLIQSNDESLVERQETMYVSKRFKLSVYLCMMCSVFSREDEISHICALVAYWWSADTVV